MDTVYSEELMCQYKERNASRLVILERTCMRNEWKMRNSLKKNWGVIPCSSVFKKKGQFSDSFADTG